MIMPFTHRPSSADYIGFAANFQQCYLVTVDVEEEFDWDQPIKRNGYTLKTISAITDFQMLCDQFGVKPLYLIDYPVIDDPVGGPLYADLVKSGRAEVGIQLHPWVSPPFDEQVTQHNSFAGNLPLALEREKLLRLRDRIAQVIGVAPISYRAGRYGLGPNSIDLLCELGIKIDTSVRSNFNYSAEGGPNYAKSPLTPYWLNKQGGLAELPLTTIFSGRLREQGPALFRRIDDMPMLKSILSRTGFLERISLTPEGIGFDDIVKGIDVAIDDGLPILNLSFHSPSLRAGHTPYVTNQAEQEAFFECWRQTFQYLATRNIAAASLSTINSLIQATR